MARYGVGDFSSFISCKKKYSTKCHLQYIRETKRQLNERFGEHRPSILNHQQLSTTTSVSLHFNQAGHSINDVLLIPIELIRSKRDKRDKHDKTQLLDKFKENSNIKFEGVAKATHASKYKCWKLF